MVALVVVVPKALLVELESAVKVLLEVLVLPLTGLVEAVELVKLVFLEYLLSKAVMVELV
jgi:hypothetical protein